MLITLMMNLNMFGGGPVPVTTSRDMHDGPPPDFLNWAAEQRRKALKQARTREEAVAAVEELVEEVAEAAPDAIQSIFHVSRLPDIDYSELLADIGLLNKLIFLYDKIRREQDVILLLLED